MSQGKLTPDTMMSASRLPGLMGYSKYSTPNDELSYSVRALQGLDREPFESEPADWGNRFENHILQESCQRLGLDTYNLEHTHPLFAKDYLPLCCSLDGTADGRGRVLTTDPDAGIFVIGQDSIVLDGEGVLEAKLTGQDVDDIPPLWRGPIQLQGQMLVTGAKWGAVCTLYKGTKLRVFVFERHQATIDAITEAVIEFQKRLDHYNATKEVDFYPPANNQDANRIWPVGDTEEVELDYSSEIWAQEITETKQEIKELQEVIEDRETKLKAKLQTAGKAVAGKYCITWPMRHYKAQPERITPAKQASVVRQSTLTIKEIK